MIKGFLRALAVAAGLVAAGAAQAQFNSGSNYNTANMSYQANSTLSQNIVFDSNMQAGGTFDFSVNAHAGGGRNNQHDTGNLRLQFYNSSGGLVTSAQTSYSQNLIQANHWSSAPGDNPEPWSTISLSYTLSAADAANVAYVKVTMIGTDASWWAGNYGPQWQMPTLTFNGSSTNILYNPEFGVAPGNVQAQGWTSSTGYSGVCGTVSGSAACVTNATGVTANMSGGGYSATGGSTSGNPGGYSSTLTSTTILATVNNGGVPPAGGGGSGGGSSPNYTEILNSNVATYTPTSNNSPASETSNKAMDGSSGTKYLNFDRANAGFTIKLTAAQVVQGIKFTTANDFEPRDPTTFTLYGSNDGINWTEITVAQSTTLSTISGRYTQTAFISISNTNPYFYYFITFPNIKAIDTYGSYAGCVAALGNLACDSVQIAEVTYYYDTNFSFTAPTLGGTGTVANPGTPGSVSSMPLPGPQPVNNSSGNTSSNPSGTTVTTVTNGGTYTNNGTAAAVTNTGTMTNGGTTGDVTNSGTFTNNGTTGDVINSGTFNNNGTTGDVNNQAAGTFNNNSGGVTGDVTNAGTFNNSGTTGDVTNSGTFTNNTGGVTGTVANNNGWFYNSGTTGDVTNSSGGIFDNYMAGITGNVTNGASSIFNNSGTTGTVSNAGTFNNNAGGTTGAVTNTGTLSNAGTVASLTNSGTASNSGTITGSVTNSSGTFTNSGTTGDWTNDATIANTGTMGDGTNNGTFTNDGTVGDVTNTGTFANNGTGGDFTNTGTLSNSGTMAYVNNNSSGSFTNSGTTGDVANDGTMDNNDGNMGAVGNSGSFTNWASSTIASLINSGAASNNGTITGTVDNSNLFTNAGTAGDVANSGTFTNMSNGTIHDLVNDAGATATNDGTIAGAITNNGTLTNTGTAGDWVNNNVMSNSGTMGDGTNTGTMTNSGNLGGVTNSGTFTFVSGNINSITNSGTLDVSGLSGSNSLGAFTQTSTGNVIIDANKQYTVIGAANLGGTVTINNAPTAFGRYTYLTAGSVTGEFAGFTANPGSNGYLKYTGTEVKYYVTPDSAATQSSIGSVANDAADVSSKVMGNIAGVLGNDCSAPGLMGGCMSIGYGTSLGNGDLQSGSMTISKAIDPKVRIGISLGDNFSSAPKAGSTEYKQNFPVTGGFIGISNPAQFGNIDVMASVAAQSGEYTITRPELSGAEGGVGKAQTNGTAFQVKATYSMPLDETTTISPYIGLRRTQMDVGGYTETGPVFPLTANPFSTTSTDVIAGVGVAKKLTDKLTANVGVGVTQNVANDSGKLSGSSEIGHLSSYEQQMNGGGKGTSASVGAGLSYEVAPGQRVTASVGWQDKTMFKPESTTVGLTWSFSF
jgi:F5/8 type C domain